MPAPRPKIDVLPPDGPRECDRFNREVAGYAKEAVDACRAQLLALATMLVETTKAKDEEIREAINGYSADLYGEAFGEFDADDAQYTSAKDEAGEARFRERWMEGA
jgi:hypothetical protein